MIDSMVLVVFVTVILNAAASGLAGAVVCRRSGVPVLQGAALGALFPWVGPAIGSFIWHEPFAQRRGGRRAWPVAVPLMTAGLLFVGATLWPWAVVTTRPAWYAATTELGIGHGRLGMTMLAALLGCAVGGGFATLAHHGLRVALPMSAVGVTLSCVVIASLASVQTLARLADFTMLNEIESATEYGRGAWCAIAGTLLLLISTQLLVAYNLPGRAFAPHAGSWPNQFEHPLPPTPHAGRPREQQQQRGDDGGGVRQSDLQLPPPPLKSDDGW